MRWIDKLKANLKFGKFGKFAETVIPKRYKFSEEDVAGMKVTKVKAKGYSRMKRVVLLPIIRECHHCYFDNISAWFVKAVYVETSDKSPCLIAWISINA